MSMSHLLRVGVLRGGPSNEHEVSLDSGAAVLGILKNNFYDRYDAHDVLIDRNGAWNMSGQSIEPHDAIRRFDVAFNALHGNYGEDGKIQSFLESHSMPFTGSGSLGSALGMNKVISKKILNDHDIRRLGRQALWEGKSWPGVNSTL